jgi:hypothetical protein
MEARASQIAEEIRQMERTYTPEFMRMDPRAKSLQSRLVEMERQIEAQRAASRQAALGAAQDEVASARATIERLQAEIRAQRSTMQNFSQRFTQAKALEDDLAQIEKASREAQERLAKLEASEQSRLPALNLVEGASVPGALPPGLPDRCPDRACRGLRAGSGGHLVRRDLQPPGAAPDARVHHGDHAPPWGGMPGAGASPADPFRRPCRWRDGPGPARRDAPAAPGTGPGEVVDLLAASAGEGRFVLGLLLLGLTAEEAAALRQGDFDAAVSVLQVTGNAPRSLKLPAWMSECRPHPSAAWMLPCCRMRRVPACARKISSPSWPAPPSMPVSRGPAA